MELRTWLFAIVILVIIINRILYHWRRRHLLTLSWKLPGPFAVPFFGNGLIFFCKDEDIFTRAVQLVSNYGSPMRIWLGPKMFVLFRKPSHIEKILTSAVFSAKDEGVYKFMREFNGNGLISESGILFSSSSPKWKNDRKILSPLFTMRMMKRFIPNMVYHSRVLVENLGFEVEKPAFNVKNYIQRSVCDLMNETIIGVTTTAHTGSMDYYLQTINRMYVLVHARIVKFWLQIEWIFQRTIYFKQQEEGKKIIHSFMKDGYEKVKAFYKKGENNQFNRSLLADMLRIQDDVPGFANDQDFVYHLTTLYSASEDTITIISSFTLVLFGLFPSIQQIAYEEVLSIIPDNKTIEEEDINRMEYLEKCIKEVMRLFPIAPFIIRTTAEDFQLDGLKIPKDCSIIVAIYNVHRDPKYWKTPDTFNPNHFLPEEVKKRPKYAYLPFSAGTRSCMGKIYAMLGLKVVLASILREFIVEADGKLDDYKLKADISVRFHNDRYPVRLKRRR